MKNYEKMHEGRTAIETEKLTMFAMNKNKTYLIWVTDLIRSRHYPITNHVCKYILCFSSAHHDKLLISSTLFCSLEEEKDGFHSGSVIRQND